MARSGHPDSAGSQFFIMVEKAPHLDGSYAAFGKVFEGMEVADAIVNSKTDWNDRPRQDQRMKSVLQCAIRDRGKNRGFIGFDECRNNRYWTQDQMETLSFLASLLSVFLLKDRAQSRMELCCAIK